MLIGRLTPNRWLSNTFFGKRFYVQTDARDLHSVMRQKHLIQLHGGHIMRVPFPVNGPPADFLIVYRPRGVPKKRRHYLHYMNDNKMLNELVEGSLEHLMVGASRGRTRSRPLVFRSAWLRKCIRERKIDTSAKTVEVFGATLVPVPGAIYGALGGPTFHHQQEDRPIKIFLDDACAQFTTMVEERGGEITTYKDAEILVFAEPVYHDMSLQQQRCITRRGANAEVARKDWIVDCIDKGWRAPAWYPNYGLELDEKEDEH